MFLIFIETEIDVGIIVEMDRAEPFIYLVGYNILVLDLRSKVIGIACKHGIVLHFESEIVHFVLTNKYNLFVALMNNGTLLEGALNGVLDIEIKVLQHNVAELANAFTEKLLSVSHDRTGVFFALFLRENGKLRKVELKRNSYGSDS